MSGAPRTEKCGDESGLPTNNSQLGEVAWQRWINKNKERDAAQRKKVIRILWLMSFLSLVGVAVWQLTTRK
jgi:hypothetical protein